MRLTKRTGLVAASVLALASLSVGAFFATHSTTHADTDGGIPLAITREHFNPLDTFSDSSTGTMSVGAFKSSAGLVCSTATTTAANVNTDCELNNNVPHNETSIAVNPTNPNNIIGGLNDYQIALNSGGQTVETIYTRAHVSFDGGRTWAMYGIADTQYTGTGDPSVAFDADGRAYMATLGFNFTQGSGTGTVADVVASTSTDGGQTWSNIVKVANGTGSNTSQGVFNDKEYIAAWGHGNAIITYTAFNDGYKGSYINSPIYDSVTHDGGKTWSTPVQISGSAPFCVGATAAAPTACDSGTASIPVIAADGSIYVAFEVLGNLSTGRDRYAVVKVDPASGATIAGPYEVADLYDGYNDYPINVDGRQTYQDSQFRTWSAGNITADPTNASHLAVIWSDMRNNPKQTYSSDPYTMRTNSDVIVSQSYDGGATWSSPTVIAKPGDQFMPWGAYDTTGHLRIGYFDRSYDSTNHAYGYTLASESKAGSLKFSYAQLTTTLSDPTGLGSSAPNGDRWFSGGVVNHATTFLGDYSNITATPSGGAAAYWTDMRNTATFPPRSGAGEDAYFAAHA